MNNDTGGKGMIEDLAKKWENSEIVDSIHEGDEYITKYSDTNYAVGIARGIMYAQDFENIRLIQRRVPRVPDDILVIAAVVVGEEQFGRRALVRVDPGDEVWYTSEEDGYNLEELSDIRAMAEVGDFL